MSSTYAARFYEGRYIQGQIAAKMSKSGVIGYIVSFPIPEVISGINSTMLGAQSDQSEHQGQDRLGQFLVRPAARRPTPPRRWSIRAPTS